MKPVLTSEQMAAFELLNDDQAGLETGLQTYDVRRYTDPEVFEQEKTAIFFREPTLVAASAELPKPGSFMRQEMLGTNLLLTRAKDGVARAFINACRHRGTVLCTEHGAQSGNKVICPYHAWTYSLDGTLVGVPREELFQGFDRTKYGLTELACVEAGGLIWVGLKPGVDYDFSIVAGPLGDELKGAQLDRMRLFAKQTYEVKANWKLIMDTMLDAYHVTRLHKNTVAKFFVDTPIHVQMIGPHLRCASARGNFTRDALSDDFLKLRKVAVLSYQLFPGGMVVGSPDYTSIGVLRPTAYNHTRVDYLMMTDHPAEDERAQDKLQRSFDLMHQVFGEEDFWAAEIGQEGLEGSDLKQITAGGMEGQMRKFHDVYEERMRRAGFTV